MSSAETASSGLFAALDSINTLDPSCPWSGVSGNGSATFVTLPFDLCSNPLLCDACQLDKDSEAALLLRGWPAHDGQLIIGSSEDMKEAVCQVAAWNGPNATFDINMYDLFECVSVCGPEACRNQLPPGVGSISFDPALAADHASSKTLAGESDSSSHVVHVLAQRLCRCETIGVTCITQSQAAASVSLHFVTDLSNNIINDVKQAIVQEIVAAVGGTNKLNPKRVKITKMTSDGLMAVLILPSGSSGGERSPASVVAELQRQAQDPNSILRLGTYGQLLDPTSPLAFTYMDRCMDGSFTLPCADWCAAPWAGTPAVDATRCECKPGFTGQHCDKLTGNGVRLHMKLAVDARNTSQQLRKQFGLDVMKALNLNETMMVVPDDVQEEEQQPPRCVLQRFNPNPRSPQFETVALMLLTPDRRTGGLVTADVRHLEANHTDRPRPAQELAAEFAQQLADSNSPLLQGQVSRFIVRESLIIEVCDGVQCPEVESDSEAQCFGQDCAWVIVVFVLGVAAIVLMVAFIVDRHLMKREHQQRSPLPPTLGAVEVPAVAGVKKLDTDVEYGDTHPPLSSKKGLHDSPAMMQIHMPWLPRRDGSATAASTATPIGLSPTKASKADKKDSDSAGADTQKADAYGEHDRTLPSHEKETIIHPAASSPQQQRVGSVSPLHDSEHRYPISSSPATTSTSVVTATPAAATSACVAVVAADDRSSAPYSS